MKNSEGEGYTPMAMHIIKILLITPMCLSVAITFPGLSKFYFFLKTFNINIFGHINIVKKI